MHNIFIHIGMPKTASTSMQKILKIYEKKIKKELNWRPKISIKQGIKNILKEIDYWNSAPVWTPKKIKVATKDWFKYLGTKYRKR